MNEQMIHVSNCPSCGHYPTQFCDGYVVHLPTKNCGQSSAHDRIASLEKQLEDALRLLGESPQAARAQGAEPVAWMVDGSLFWHERQAEIVAQRSGNDPQPLCVYSPANPESVPEWMGEISGNLKTQNNRITQDPLFVVFQKREIVTNEEFDYDRISWGSCDGEASEEIQDQLNELYDDPDSNFFREDQITHATDEGTETWQRAALKEIDEFVTACFTEAGAKAYLESNQHNLSRPFIYVTSLFRNEEMKRLREWLLSTAIAPQAEGWVKCSERLPGVRSIERKKPNGILTLHENGRITQFREVTESLREYMSKGPRQPKKFEASAPPAIVAWFDLDESLTGLKRPQPPAQGGEGDE